MAGVEVRDATSRMPTG